MQFTISGKRYDITRETVLRTTRNAPPRAGDGRSRYFVELHGRQYPIKQVLGLITGLAPLAFTAQYPHRILTKLGFDVTKSVPGTAMTMEAAAGGDAGTTGPQDAHRPVGVARGRDAALKLLVVFETDEDGWVVASCPTLPGCHSQGRTRGDALTNIREAIRGYLASMRERGDPLPSSSTFEVVEAPI